MDVPIPCGMGEEWICGGGRAGENKGGYEAHMSLKAWSLEERASMGHRGRRLMTRMYGGMTAFLNQ